MSATSNYHPLGNESRKDFIRTAKKAAQHFGEFSLHLGKEEQASPRTNLDMSKVSETLHRGVAQKLGNLAKDTDRGSFAGLTELSSGIANAFNQVFRAANGDSDEHEYQNHVLSSVMKFLSTPGLKQAAYDLQDDLETLTKTREVNPVLSIHRNAA